MSFGLLAFVLIVLSVIRLEGGRSGLEISPMRIGAMPATLYSRPGAIGPLVVVAHGFAGSRQLMQAYSLTLAQAGYIVLALDFEGHGRNPVPMSGDVTSIDGTTALLVAETRRVIAAGRTLPGIAGGVAQPDAVERRPAKLCFMLLFMWHIYEHMTANVSILVAAAIVFAGLLGLVRGHATVGNVAYMKAMVLQHSIAFMTSERARISDPFASGDKLGHGAPT